jgi:hypothetical protein
MSLSFDSSISREGSEVLKHRNLNSSWSAAEVESVPSVGIGREPQLSQRIRLSLENVHPYLFTKLTATMGVALRALDCATKAYGSARLDFAVHVSREYDKMELLRDEFLTISYEAKMNAELSASEKSLMEAVVAIFIALSLTCEYSYDAVSHMAALIGNEASENLDRMRRISDCNNRCLRLCLVALVNGEADHALNALRKIEALNGMAREGDELWKMKDPQASQSAWRELAIATYLKKISHNIRMVAARLIDAEVAVTQAGSSNRYRRSADSNSRGIISSSAHGNRCASKRLGASTSGCAADREAMRNS